MQHIRWGILTAAVTMALAVAAAGRIWAGPAVPNAQKIEVRVDSVVASDTHQGIDTELTPMGPRLRSLFSYTTYHLVSHAARQTAMGNTLAFDLPGGRILHVEPSAIDGDMIAMELVLFEGPRPVMTTDLKLRNHGVLILGGPRYEQGMLIVEIGADCRCPRPRTADATSPRE